MWILLIFLGVAFTGVSSQNCPNQFSTCPPSKVVAALESSVLLPCRTKKAIETCLWKIPAEKRSVRPLPNNEFYVRENPDDAQSCDLRIVSLQDKDHGNWTCSPLLKDEVSEIYSSPVYVSVAIPPTEPYIHYKDDIKPEVIQLKERELVAISCHVESSRPEAKIYWYLGTYNKEVTAKNVTSSAHTTVALLDLGDDLVKTTSALSLTFQAEHNRQQIWCKTDHMALRPQAENTAYARLDVQYNPRFNSTTSEFVFEVDTEAKLKVLFRANPKPADGKDVKLIIEGRESVQAGKVSSDGTVEVAMPETEQGGLDLYSTTITFPKLTTELSKRDYIFSVTNRIFRQPVTHKVTVEVTGSGKTDESPFGLAAGIIVGVAAIAIGILIYYSWSKSKWCFKPDEHEKVSTIESNDRPMTDMSQRSSQPISQRPMA